MLHVLCTLYIHNFLADGRRQPIQIVLGFPPKWVSIALL